MFYFYFYHTFACTHIKSQVGRREWIKNDFAAKIADFTPRYYTRENSQKYKLSIEPLKIVRVLFSIYKYPLSPQSLESGMYS